ncbi:DUF4956 domain-containing protein [Lewinella sp. LCG006]|uniref:DUF4956 domain-containing protein n=1 Tax=Lewinella sp. LCG006 TaxID=3231911 RepID=UPI00345FA011
MIDLSLFQTNVANPTFISTAYAMLLAFILGCLLAFTYEKTTAEIRLSHHFLQALILGAIVAATVMHAIGDSLARGLGMLGALAIIRFRTSINNPRNIIFMFAALATGIACGVYGFNAAFAGVMSFCGAAFMLRYSPFGKTQELGSIRFKRDRENSFDEQEIEAILLRFCKRIELSQLQLSVEEFTERELFRYEYIMVLKPKAKEEDLMEAIMATGVLFNVRINRKQQTEVL